VGKKEERKKKLENWHPTTSSVTALLR